MFNTYADDHTLSQESVRFLLSLTNSQNPLGIFVVDYVCDTCGFCEDCDEFEHCVFCFHGDILHSGDPTKICDDWELENCFYCSDEYWGTVEHRIWTSASII